MRPQPTRSSETARSTEIGDASFPAGARLRTRADYEYVRRNGQKVDGEIVRFFVAPSQIDSARLGLAVSRRYGNAVRRNRFKRLTREAFRRTRRQLPAVDIVATPRRFSGTLSLHQIFEDFDVITERFSRETP